jgi:RNA polymerase sigma factor (sigma-70 family)
VQGPVHKEQELLTEMAAGKRTATEEIYTANYDTITKWIMNNGGNEPDAADTFQEAMMILYEKAQQQDFRLSCKIGTYVFAVSKRLWYKKLQKLQRQPVQLAGEDGGNWVYEEDINAHYEREEHYRQLHTALDQLGEPCRSLLKAYYQHDKSMQDIAADFGYTNADNAKTQKYKCLARLKKIFYGVQEKM